MKTILQKLVRITLVVSLVFACIGYFFILGPTHHFNNDYINYFLLIIGIGLIVLFGMVLLIVRLFSFIKIRKKEPDLFEKILRGSKFRIDLDTVRIKSNSWESSRFIQTHLHDIEIKEKNIQTILEFDVETAGGKKTFHWPSEMEPKSLEMYFAIQKETDFYLDPEDDSKCYLDLRFITN